MIRYLMLVFVLGVAGCSSSPTESIPHDMRDGIKAALKTNQDKISKCFSDALKRKSFSEGTVHLQWDINEKGRAKNTAVKLVENQPPVDPKFDKCLTTTIEKIKFPAAPKNQHARVVYPFTFRK